MSDNKDLLDLCRLNLMEETVIDSPAFDREETLKVIDFKKRQLSLKIPRLKTSEESFKQHLEANQPIEQPAPRKCSGSGLCPHDIECVFTDWPVRTEWDNKYCTCSYRLELDRQP